MQRLECRYRDREEIRFCKANRSSWKAAWMIDLMLIHHDSRPNALTLLIPFVVLLFDRKMCARGARFTANQTASPSCVEKLTAFIIYLSLILDLLYLLVQHINARIQIDHVIRDALEARLHVG